MQKFFSKYALAAHLALLAVAPLFLFPFYGVEDIAVVLLWMSLFTGLWLFLEPSRRVDEYLFDARRRVFRSIVRDPLCWILGLFLLLAFVRWMNGGVSLVYDISGKEWGWKVDRPAVEWLPGSADGAGFASFAVLLAVTVVLLSCRHALGKSARIMFVFLASFFAAVAAVAAVFLVKNEIPSVCAAAFCDYSNPSFAGSAFGLFFLAGIVSLAGMFERRWMKAMTLFSFAAGATFVGLFCFAPPSVILLYSTVGVALLLGTAVYVSVTKGSLAFFKLLAALLLAAGTAVAMLRFVAPAELLEFKSAVMEFEIFPAGYFEQRERYSSIAVDIWHGSGVWHGGGVASLPMFIKLDLPESSWVDWICNGWGQFLAERGVIGFSIFVLPFCFMAVSFFARLFVTRGKQAFWPLVSLGLLCTVTVAVEGFFNASFMRPEVLIAVGAFFAVSVSSIPIRRAENDVKKDNSGK